jgi:hypothetical protein
MLDQIQSYENLVGPIVESLKYLTGLSQDVLTCTVAKQRL